MNNYLIDISIIKIKFSISKGVEFQISGTSGHGSLLLKDTAGEKLNRILNKFFLFRQKQNQKLADNPKWTIGDVTTVNMTVINGAEQNNVVPSYLEVRFDIRVAVDISIEEMDKEVTNDEFFETF